MNRLDEKQEKAFFWPKIAGSAGLRLLIERNAHLICALTAAHRPPPDHSKGWRYPGRDSSVTDLKWGHQEHWVSQESVE